MITCDICGKVPESKKRVAVLIEEEPDHPAYVGTVISRDNLHLCQHCRTIAEHRIRAIVRPPVADDAMADFRAWCDSKIAEINSIPDSPPAKPYTLEPKRFLDRGFVIYLFGVVAGSCVTTFINFMGWFK